MNDNWRDEVRVRDKALNHITPPESANNDTIPPVIQEEHINAPVTVHGNPTGKSLL